MLEDRKWTTHSLSPVGDKVQDCGRNFCAGLRQIPISWMTSSTKGFTSMVMGRCPTRDRSGSAKPQHAGRGRRQNRRNNRNPKKAPYTTMTLPPLWKPEATPVSDAPAAGYEPIGFKGGHLQPLWKGKGSMTDPTAYRGILLAESLCSSDAQKGNWVAFLHSRQQLAFTSFACTVAWGATFAYQQECCSWMSVQPFTICFAR